jgi:hypothetical protein
MKQIPLTQGLFASVDDDDFEELSKFKWYASKDRNSYYARRTEYLPDGKQKTVWMHRQILSLADSNIHCDHIDGDGLNNQKFNLRPCLPGQNRLNARRRKDSGTGAKGVIRMRRSTKFYAQTGHEGKRISLGSFETLDEARNAYNEAAKKVHGEFARLDKGN